MRTGPLPEHEKEHLRQLYKGKPRLYRRTTKYGKQINIKYHSVKRAATSRGIAYELTREQVEDLVVKPCWYCGKESENVGHINTYKTKGINGLDRIDSTLPYTTDNVVPCCWKCNAAKNDQTVEEFKEWLKRAYHHTVGVLE